jgi:hypothetical protein
MNLLKYSLSRLFSCCLKGPVLYVKSAPEPLELI